jgi:hypothetical protein
MQQLEHRVPDRLVVLTRQFHRAVERQRKQDALIVASVLRSLRSPAGEPLRQVLREFRT